LVPLLLSNYYDPYAWDSVAGFWQFRCWEIDMAKKASRSGDTKGKNTIQRVMKERKEGTLKSGSGKKVTSRKQAVAIALSEARKSGAKIPKKKA
jgi:hypothetical protein